MPEMIRNSYKKDSVAYTFKEHIWRKNERNKGSIKNKRDGTACFDGI